MQEQRDAVLTVISRYRPFGVCPLAGPHAISDSFGVLHRHGSKREVGTHIHQGVDIATAMGTPVLAPFDGTAVASASRIGGRAVKVLGEWGYVYNAHLSAYGQLGAVQRGDVIGYAARDRQCLGVTQPLRVHPGGGPAVDPHELLVKVCSTSAESPAV
ncbi:MAG: M23 family metallopeptidase [Actinomycetota bacterium]